MWRRDEGERAREGERKTAKERRAREGTRAEEGRRTKGKGRGWGRGRGWRGEAARSERGPAACTDARGSPSCPCGVPETRRLRGHQLRAKLVAFHPCRLWVCLGFSPPSLCLVTPVDLDANLASAKGGSHEDGGQSSPAASSPRPTCWPRPAPGLAGSRISFAAPHSDPEGLSPQAETGVPTANISAPCCWPGHVL